MSRFKIIFWVLVFGFLATLFFQNLDFFMLQTSIRIVTYESSALPIGVYCLIFFAAGLLIAYFGCLPERFKLKKIIKQLSAAMPPQPPQAPMPVADSPSSTVKTDVSDGTPA